MSTLIVELPREAGLDFAYALSPDGHALSAQASAQAGLLPRADEIVAVVPWRRLSWHRIRLPKVANARLRSALDGVLEDQLLDEGADLHLALEPAARAGEEAWVAACDRAWLREALQTLEKAGRSVQRIVPDWSPTDPGLPRVVGQADDAWLISPAGTQAGSPLVLPLALAAREFSAQERAGARVTVLAEPGVAALAEEVLQCRVEVRPHSVHLLASAQGEWNLAQFDFASAAGGRLGASLARVARNMLSGRDWRLARWGVAAIVGVQLVGLNAWALKQRSAVESRRTQVAGLLTQTFPHVKLVIDPQVQMERELAVLRQASGAVSSRDLESLLGALAGVMPRGQVPASIEFTPGELRLRSVRPDSAQLAEMSRRLGAYRLRQEGADLVIQSQGSTR